MCYLIHVGEAVAEVDGLIDSVGGETWISYTFTASPFAFICVFRVIVLVLIDVRCCHGVVERLRKDQPLSTVWRCSCAETFEQVRVFVK